MAALTSANVRTIRAWTEGALTGKRRSVRMVEVHGGAWGGGSNTMPATAFGLRVIEEVTPANYGDKVYPLVPSSSGATIYAFNGAGSGVSAGDVTVGATPLGMYFTVKGY